MTKDKVTALSCLFRYNKTIDYYIRSQYQDMRTSRLVTLSCCVLLLWPIFIPSYTISKYYTINYSLRSQYQDMRTSKLGTQGDLTWPRPTAEVRSGHWEWQVDKVTALSCLFRYNKTIDYYIRSQYQDMRTSRLVTLSDLTWPRPLASVRSGLLECQVSRSSYPGIDFLGSN
jgi:hypothetical protein